ncbi:hypothetical protein E8E11_006440 [Didymella keratinophila]|nr:hypothetical protein E8E11_006440 [Didymella keratinophila]
MATPTPKNDVTRTENVREDGAEQVEVKVYIHAKTIIAVLAVCSIFFVQLMTVVGAGSLGRYMASSLGSPTLSAWFSSSITILTLATILPVSQAADYWGRKNFILGMTTLGLIGAIMVSRAQNIATAIAGMVLVGSAFGCQSICYAVPSEILHRKYRAYGQAATNVFSGLGGVSGVLITLFTIGLVGIFFGYNPPKRELEVAMGSKEKLRSMDWIGGFLIAVGLVLLVVALQYSGNPYTWKDGHVLGPFVSGILCLAAFGAPGILHRYDGRALQEAFKVSFSKLWIAAAVFSAVGVICSCFISNPKSQFNEHIDAPVEVEVAHAQEVAEKGRYDSA